MGKVKGFTLVKTGVDFLTLALLRRDPDSTTAWKPRCERRFRALHMDQAEHSKRSWGPVGTLPGLREHVR